MRKLIRNGIIVGLLCLVIGTMQHGHEFGTALGTIGVMLLGPCLAIKLLFSRMGLLAKRR